MILGLLFATDPAPGFLIPEVDPQVALLLGPDVLALARPTTGAQTVTAGGPQPPGRALFVPAFDRDFYGRIHISVSKLDLGNVVGQQARVVSLWNAYGYGVQLDSESILNGDGLLVYGQPDPPFAMAPLEERSYQIQIGIEGPPTIDTTILWNLTPGGQLRLSITGSRVTPWAWRPDWSKGINETLEWRTDIIESEGGDEQRIGTRLTPRQTWEFTASEAGTERQAMQAASLGWGGRTWALPQWPHGYTTTADLAAGVSTIALPTFARQFKIGGLAMLMGESSLHAEVAEILDVQANALVFKRGLQRAWPANTTVYPAISARFDNSASFKHFTGYSDDLQMRFSTVGPVDYPELAGLPIYRTRPVFDDKPEWSSEPELLADRKMADQDNGVGLINHHDRTGIPVLRQSHTWTPLGRVELDRIRGLQYLLRGARGSVWVPSWTDDLTVVATAGASSQAIDVAYCGYTAYLKGMNGRTDIRIQAPNGTVQYARITGSSVVSEDVERLGIDVGLTALLDPADPRGIRISFLTLWRLDTDRLEWAWWSGDMRDDHAHATCPMPMRNFRNDV